MDFHASYNFPSTNEMIHNLGLEEAGPVQTFFTNEVWRLSDDYVPFSKGILKDNVAMQPDKIIYTSIYAQYQWYGNLMVDPDYLVGAFPYVDSKYGIQTGFFSRPGVPKILDPDGRKLNNFDGLRGPYWTDRMWADRHEEIENAVQNKIKEISGKR